MVKIYYLLKMKKGGQQLSEILFLLGQQISFMDFSTNFIFLISIILWGFLSVGRLNYPPNTAKTLINLAITSLVAHLMVAVEKCWAGSGGRVVENKFYWQFPSSIFINVAVAVALVSFLFLTIR